MNELQFNDHKFTIIQRNGKTWLTAADVSRALGYVRADQVSRIYERHLREFSQSMTVVHQTVTLGKGMPPVNMRLFSLRGAHLIAMFSRTAKGEEFRRWVLDLLDEREAQSKPNYALLTEAFNASEKINLQTKSASECGRGLSNHKKLLPSLEANLARIKALLQPSLCF